MKQDTTEFQDRSAPKAYLITFRCYGTWLPGDERGSVDRRYHNRFGTPKIEPDPVQQIRKANQMKSKVLILEAPERTTVEKAVREVCEVRGYRLYALNVRTNHAHLVVGNAGTPERMMDSFKAYATRALRGNGLLGAGEKAWSRHGSTRYLWTEEHLAAPVEYVVSGQGGEFRGFD